MPSPPLIFPVEGADKAPRGYAQLTQATREVNLLEEANVDESSIGETASAASGTAGSQNRKMLRSCRYSITVGLVVGMLGLAAYDRLWVMAERVGCPPTVEDLRGATQLWHAIEGPLDVNQNCVADGSLCICGDPSTCKQWYFKVGDVLIFEPAYVNNAMQWLEAGVSALLFWSDAMHVAIVTEITSQSPEGIILAEALKPPVGMVKKSKLRYILHRWPLSGFWIKRPDPARFSINPVAIKTWSDQVQGQPFDRKMIVPFFRRIITNGRFIKQLPDAAEKQRALDLYAAGGPGRWICTQLVAWLLAFPGGMNSLASWPILNLQGTPADVERFTIWQDPDWHIKCNKDGCYLANPA